MIITKLNKFQSMDLWKIVSKAMTQLQHVCLGYKTVKTLTTIGQRSSKPSAINGKQVTRISL